MLSRVQSLSLEQRVLTTVAVVIAVPTRRVAQISQALIFITRSHGFFFMERPSVALFLAFCLAQLISSIIAAYGDWGFTDVRGISGGWIGITWCVPPRSLPLVPESLLTFFPCVLLLQDLSLIHI